MSLPSSSIYKFYLLFNIFLQEAKEIIEDN